jgi:DNA-binding GntR family transcriptional regulator
MTKRTQRRSTPAQRLPHNFDPVEHVTLCEQAYKQIRDALMEGRFAPGSVIPTQSVARALGTSTMPVRDALTRLVAEKALVLGAGRSARVPVLSGRRFIELCEVRTLLEGHAAELAAHFATPDDVREIAEWNELTRKALGRRDTLETLKCNFELHFSIYRAAHQELLLQNIEPTVAPERAVLS